MAKEIRFTECPAAIITEQTEQLPFTSAIVFGAGSRGAEAITTLQANNVEVLLAIDNDSGKHHKQVQGIEIRGTDFLKDYDGAIVIASMYDYQISLQLVAEGNDPARFYYFRPESSVTVLLSCLKNKDKLQKLYDNLEDDESRFLLNQSAQMLAFGYWGNAKRSLYEQYDHPMVRACSGDVILDVGGHEGETATFFADRVGKNCHIYSFEPSQKNKERFSQATSDYKDVVTLIEYGTWSHATTLSFNTNYPEHLSGSHRVDVKGKETIPVIDIDSVVESKGIPVHMIKMDIEGAELQALQGAQRTIARYLPKLQISIYHKPAHLWEIYEFINSIAGNYEYYIGHHSHMDTETILYARQRQN